MRNLEIFYTTILDGNMNTAARFYREGMSKAEIRADFDARRIKVGQEFGFDGLKVLTPIQKSRPNLSGKTEEEQKQLLAKYQSKYADGAYVRITEEMIEPYEDLYDLDIYSDILMIDEALPGVALAYPVADCPVVFAQDMKNGITAMAHCGGEYIDRELPGQIVDALREETGTNVENIYITVGPFAQTESFTYDCVPSWIQNPNHWIDCLYEQNGLLHINMAKAIVKQMLSRNIQLKNISISPLDTITDSRFYSNNASRFDEARAGRFYTGCFYQKDKKLTLHK